MILAFCLIAFGFIWGYALLGWKNNVYLIVAVSIPLGIAVAVYFVTSNIEDITAVVSGLSLGCGAKYFRAKR